MKQSIGKQFTVTIIIAVIILSVLGSALVLRIFTVQKQQAVELQTEVGKRAKNEFLILTNKLSDKLTIFTKLWDPLACTQEQQQSMLSKLRSYKDQRHDDIIDEIIIFNIKGQVLSSASRTSLRPNPNNYSWSALKNRFHESPRGQTYFGPIENDKNGEPFMVLAVPFTNFQTGEVKGVLASRIRINLIWNNVVRKPVGQSGIIYIANKKGLIVSHPNPSIVLRKVVMEKSSQTNFHTDLDGEKIIRVVEDVDLGNQAFSIYVDRPASEALALTIQSVIIISVFILFFLVAGGASGVFFTKKIIRPIESLASTAQKIEGGDLACGSAIKSDNELGMLSQAFNNMVTRLLKEISMLKSSEDALQESKNELDNRVKERTAYLQQALDEVKILRGILPICSYCKNIRNDDGYYEQIEGYIHKHSGVDFSHTICPTCAKKYYPEEYASIVKKNGE